MSEAASNIIGSQNQVSPAENQPKFEQAKMIEPTVNKTAEMQPEPKAPNNIQNNSIINQKENEIPSLKNQSKSHNQNQAISINKNQKPQNHGQPETTMVNKGQSKPVETKQSTKLPSKTQISAPKTDTNKVQAPTQVNKIQPPITNSSQSNIKPNETQIKAPQQQKKSETEITPKLQQPQTSKQNQDTINETQKLSKDVQIFKDIKKDDPKNLQNSKQQNLQKIVSEQKPQVVKVTQQTKQQSLKSKPQQLAKQASVSSKVIDSVEQVPTKNTEDQNTKQVQILKKSQKSINPKPQQTSSLKSVQKQQLPLSNEGISFNQLLKLLLSVTKQKQEKAKTKTQAKISIVQDSLTDLNLNLTPLQSSSQYPQNRIKLQFKIIQNNQSNLSKFQNFLEKPQDKQQQPQKSESSPQQNSPLPQTTTDKKSSDFQLKFYMYNLKEPKAKNLNQSQKQKIKSGEILQKIFEQETSSFDKNEFSFKISQKDQLEPEKNKLPLRTFKFNFSRIFIMNSLGIKLERLNQLHAILQSLEQKSQKTQIHHSKVPQDMDKSQNQNKEEFRQKAQNNKKVERKNLVKFSTSAQLCLFSPLKNIASQKFLGLVSNGFKLRLQAKREKQFGYFPNFFEKALREVIFSLSPSLLSDYLKSISSGTVNIKFRQIKDVRKLLSRLGIDQIFDETPTVKELLKDLAQIQLKSLFKIEQIGQKGQKTQKTQKGQKTQRVQKTQRAQKRDQKLENSQDKVVNYHKVSEIWKILKKVFKEANCQGLSMEITLYQRFAIRLTAQCCSKNISQLWNEAIK